ncbi:retrovirus-related Pol polyprotein from transposon 17.6 [Trichonephila clavipes]|nr:retrovirus-related Pol polyprotein from transposon 17.6 [Trichonephila clavipes]
MNSLNLSIDDRQSRAEQQLQVTNSQLETSFRVKNVPGNLKSEILINILDRYITLETQIFLRDNDDVYSKNHANMGKANQFQRQFPKLNRSVRIDREVSCYVCGGPHFARNCTKKTMNSENKNKDTEGAKLELHTDARKLGLGAVLLQQVEDGRFYPIHYMIKRTSIQKEKLYFDYEVVHRPAKQMQHVDALSSHPVILVISDKLTYKIVNPQESDEYIRTIKKLLQEGVKMKIPEDVMIRNMLEEESQEQLFQHRDNLRRKAKENILKNQEENRRTYNQNEKKRINMRKVTLWQS